MDLCAKDRAIGHGAEMAMDADEAMSRETNKVEFMGLGASATIDLEENTKGKRQGSTSFVSLLIASSTSIAVSAPRPVALSLAYKSIISSQL